MGFPSPASSWDSQYPSFLTPFVPGDLGIITLGDYPSFGANPTDTTTLPRINASESPTVSGLAADHDSNLTVPLPMTCFGSSHLTPVHLLHDNTGFFSPPPPF